MRCVLLNEPWNYRLLRVSKTLSHQRSHLIYCEFVLLAESERDDKQPLEQCNQSEEEQGHELGGNPGKEQIWLCLPYGDPDASKTEHFVGGSDPEEHLEQPQQLEEPGFSGHGLICT